MAGDGRGRFTVVVVLIKGERGSEMRCLYIGDRSGVSGFHNLPVPPGSFCSRRGSMIQHACFVSFIVYSLSLCSSSAPVFFVLSARLFLFHFAVHTTVKVRLQSASAVTAHSHILDSTESSHLELHQHQDVDHRGDDERGFLQARCRRIHSDGSIGPSTHGHLATTYFTW